MLKQSIRHLREGNQSYFSHLLWAVYAGVKMIFVGISSIIHGVFPALFTGTAAKTIIDFYHDRLVDHPNKDYRDYISKKLTK